MEKYYFEKSLRRIAIPKESERGKSLLEESYRFKDLYLHSTTEFDSNKYFRLYAIFAEMAAYDFGFKNVDDMRVYILQNEGRDLWC